MAGLKTNFKSERRKKMDFELFYESLYPMELHGAGAITNLANLCLILTDTNFSINKDSMFLFKYLKTPSSLQASISQIYSEGYWAFLEADKQMDTIRMLSSQVPESMRSCRNIILDGTVEDVNDFLPIELAKVQRISKDCKEASKTAIEKFSTVMNSMQEIQLTVVNEELLKEKSATDIEFVQKDVEDKKDNAKKVAKLNKFNQTTSELPLMQDIIKEGLYSMENLREDWCKQLQFFTRLYKDTQELFHPAKMTKQQLYNITEVAEKQALAVQSLSESYCKISSNHLLPLVSKLSRLLVLDKEDTKVQRENMLNEAKTTEKTIKRIIEENDLNRRALQMGSIKVDDLMEKFNSILPIEKMLKIEQKTEDTTQEEQTMKTVIENIEAQGENKQRQQKCTEDMEQEKHSMVPGCQNKHTQQCDPNGNTESLQTKEQNLLIPQGQMTQPEDQGKSNTCTRHALSKALTGGLHDGTFGIKIDVSQEYVTAALVNKSKDVGERWPTDFDQETILAMDRKSLEYYTIEIKVAECTFDDLHKNWNNSKFVVVYRKSLGLHCIYVHSIINGKLCCINSYGKRDQFPQLKPGNVLAIYKVNAKARNPPTKKKMLVLNMKKTSMSACQHSFTKQATEIEYLKQELEKEEENLEMLLAKTLKNEGFERARKEKGDIWKMENKTKTRFWNFWSMKRCLKQTVSVTPQVSDKPKTEMKKETMMKPRLNSILKLSQNFRGA